MKLESFRRLIKEDVDEKDRPLMDKIGYSINSFADQVLQAFKNNITIEDNLNWSKRQIEVTVDASGIPTMPSQFKSGISSSTYGISVEKAVNVTTPLIFPTTAPFISFSESNSLITINNISGLPSGNKFRLNLIIKG